MDKDPLDDLSMINGTFLFISGLGIITDIDDLKRFIRKYARDQAAQRAKESDQ